MQKVCEVIMQGIRNEKRKKQGESRNEYAEEQNHRKEKKL